MVVLPFLGGCVLLPVFRKGDYKASPVFLAGSGLCIHFFIYEILTLAGRPLGLGMRTVTAVFAVITVCLSVCGAVFIIKFKSVLIFPSFKGLKKDPCFWVAALLILVQILAILIYAAPDPDDAFYSSISSMSYAYDLLLEKDAYAGLMRKAIQKRYALSALPIYQAGLSVLSARLHHLFISHNLFPAFYMPLAYGLYAEIARGFLSKHEKKGDGAKEPEETPEKTRETGPEPMSGKDRLSVQTGPILLALAACHMVGDYYIFSQEAFLLTRLWQGKALFAAIGIPFLYLLGMKAEKMGIWGWVMTAVTMIAIVFMGGTGLFLAPVMVVCQHFALFIISDDKKKGFLRVIAAAVCCIPEAVLALWMVL